MKEKYYFFLNPYTDAVFMKCPKCETKTTIRKYCLLIHVEPSQLISINMSCRYCSYCDMIIAKKDKLESILYAVCKENFLDIKENEYLVFGVLNMKDWKKTQKENVYPKTLLKKAYVFKAVWKFDFIPR